MLEENRRPERGVAHALIFFVRKESYRPRHPKAKRKPKAASVWKPSLEATPGSLVTTTTQLKPPWDVIDLDPCGSVPPVDGSVAKLIV